MNVNTQNTKENNDTISLSLDSNIKKIVIDGIRFEMNIDDPEVFKALLEFKESHNDHPSAINDDVDMLLDDCAYTIDIVLGEGTCDKLFKNPSMKMYLLVNELAKIYLENFMKKEREEAEARHKKEMESLKEIIRGMSDISKMMAYADNKYGNRGINNYVRNKKSSKKNKGKRK